MENLNKKRHMMAIEASEDLIKVLDELAEAETISRSAYVRRLILAYLKASNIEYKGKK